MAWFSQALPTFINYLTTVSHWAGPGKAYESRMVSPIVDFQFVPILDVLGRRS